MSGGAGAPRIALVVAMARNRVIGRGGALAWRIRADLKWFKSVTMGKPIVMGRKTWESIGKPLPGRTNIVVTRAHAYAAPGATVAGSLDAALEIARAGAPEEICIIGGGEIYAQALARADRLYLTEVEADVDGDTWFPPFDRAQWSEREDGRIEKGPDADHACRFLVLDRRRG